jgi:hypothetical protein
MSGWIKLHRKLLEWEWYSKPVVKSVFIHSLLRANHKDGKWRGIDVKRGSYISSVDKLIKELGHSRQEIRTALKHLKSTNELTTSSAPQHTVFTVVGYENYQDATNELTNEQPTANQRATTNKNVKNDKNDKKLNPIVQPEVKPSKFKYSDYQFQFAQWMHSLILNVTPDKKAPNFEAWANTIRLMMESDKRNGDQMVEVFTWANLDSFWSSNILGPTKFRKQYDQLSAKMNGNVKQSQTAERTIEQTNQFVDELEDQYQRSQAAKQRREARSMK